MPRRRSVLAAAMVLLGLHSWSTQAADLLDPPPSAATIARDAAGRWARYRVAYPLGRSKQDLRITLLRATPRQTLWELSTEGSADQARIVRRTVDMIGHRPGGATDQILASGRQGSIPLRIPVELRRAAFRAADARAPVGKESIGVPAGRFECTHSSRLVG